MCISPLTLNDGTAIACRQCWQCREHTVNDWVGRNIAESKTAKASHAVTLTYGRNRAGDADHERANILTYSDVQKFFKRLRKAGYPVRYFVTGEFGSTKGRAHWHVMLYWQDQVPEVKLDTDCFTFEHWPHGFSQWTKPTAHAVRYNCKYIQKDMGDAERQGHLAMSKKPPLGAAYFARMAEQFVRQGLAPQSLEYRFPDVRRRKEDGTERVVPFLLGGRSAELFLDHYVEAWEAAYPGREVPPSELVNNWVEFGATSVPESAARYGEWIDRRRQGVAMGMPNVPRPRGSRGETLPWMRFSQIQWHKELGAWIAPDRPGSGGLLKWQKVEGRYTWRKIRGMTSGASESHAQAWGKRPSPPPL